MTLRLARRQPHRCTLERVALGLLLWPLLGFRGTGVSGVAGWGADAHEKILRWATDALTSKQKAKVQAFMKGDLIGLGSFEKELIAKNPKAEALHYFQREWTCNKGIDDETGRMRCDDEAAGPLCVALLLFNNHFAHDPMLRQYPALDEKKIQAPKTLPQAAMSALASLKESPDPYLSWLLTMLADIHQPLHWLKDNGFGKDVQVRYKDRTMTLLELFEEDLPKDVAGPDKKHELKKAKPLGLPQDRNPMEAYHTWGVEAATLLCAEIYRELMENHEGKRVLRNPYDLTDEVRERWKGHVEHQIRAAGERTADVLRDLLEHKRHKHAHSEGRGHHHHHKRNWMANALTNFGVACVLVPLVLVGIRCHAKHVTNKVSRAL